MKKVLVFGGTGKLGKVLVSYFLIKNYKVVVFSRNPLKLNILNKNLKIIKGDITNPSDISRALNNIDIVISVLGHGFRSKYPILEVSLKYLIPEMDRKGIKRFITLTGAALKTERDPNSFALFFTEKVFNTLDPYRISDARNQYKLLKKSKLYWTLVRTPVHKNGNLEKLKSIGYSQPKPWVRISRKSIAQFIFECIEENKYIRESPIIF